MKQVTSEQVEKSILAKAPDFVTLRECSVCGSMLGYSFEEGHPWYHSACDCVSYYTPPQPRSWDEIAETINMQNDEWRPKMAALFGIEMQKEG